MQKIQLGDLAKDIISGLQGIAVADSLWLNGCRRVTIQPQEFKDGKPAESVTFDEEQLVLVKSNVVPGKGRDSLTPVSANEQAEPLRRTGGTGPEPVRHAGPTR